MAVQFSYYSFVRVTFEISYVHIKSIVKYFNMIYFFGIVKFMYGIVMTGSNIGQLTLYLKKNYNFCSKLIAVSNLSLYGI